MDMNKTAIFIAMLMLVLASCDREPKPKDEWEIRYDKRQEKIKEMTAKCKDCVLIDSLDGLEWTYQVQERLGAKSKVISGNIEIMDVIERRIPSDSIDYVIRAKYDYTTTFILDIHCDRALFGQIYPHLKNREAVMVLGIRSIGKPLFTMAAFGEAYEYGPALMEIEAPEAFIMSADLLYFEEI